MCGRTTTTVRRVTLAQLLDVDEVDAPELPISWNVAPTQTRLRRGNQLERRSEAAGASLGAGPELGQGPEDRLSAD